MPCFLTEAAPRACTRRHSIAMATSCHLALCWLYSKEIEAQVDSNPRRTRNQPPQVRERGSCAARYQQYLLSVCAHADDNQERNRRGFAVEADPHHGAVKDQPHDR